MGRPEPAAVGVSVFVADGFIHHLKTFPWTWIGPTLTDRVLSNTSGILTAEEVREANSRARLNLAIWTGVVSRFHTDPMIHVELFRGFFDTHLGYQIKEVVCQPLDQQQIHATFHAGLFWLSEDGKYVDGRSQNIAELSGQPFLVGGDREIANRAFGSWFSGLLLTYTPPHLYFRPAEQRLLLAALSGVTDEELTEELGISLSAVKKTWRVIHQRANRSWSNGSPEAGDGGGNRRRGKEKKQHLLSYLRKHMEELRPLLLPRKHASARDQKPIERIGAHC